MGWGERWDRTGRADDPRADPTTVLGFADSLGDVRSDTGTLVSWDGWTTFARTNEQPFGVALEIVRERAESPLGGPFVVLMRKEEPEPGGEGQSTVDDV